MLNRPTKRIPVLTLDLQPAMVGQSKKETAERFFQGVKVFVPTTIEDAVMVFPNLFDGYFEPFGSGGMDSHTVFSPLTLDLRALL